MSLPIETTYLRPRLWIFGLTIVIILITYYLVIEKLGTIETGIHVAFLIGISLITLLWLGMRKVTVVIDNWGLTYTTHFSSKELRWKEVTKTYLKYKDQDKKRDMCLYLETPTQPDFCVSTGFYSRRSLQAIALAVVEKCKNAEIEERILNMAEGRFPWYIF